VAINVCCSSCEKRDGWLCPIRVKALTAGELDLSSVRVTRQEHGRDLNPTDVAQQLDTDESLLALGAQIVEAVEGRPTVVFTPSVLMAHRLAAVLTHLGLSTRAIDGETPKADRSETLASLAAGTVRCVTNCAVLTEGWDCPSISAVVVLRPTKSRSLYAQMIGRGTRMSPGKIDCLVCDLTSNSDDHTLVTPLDCLGGKPLPDDVRKLAQAAMADGDDLEAAIAKAEKEAERREAMRAAKLARKAKTRVTAKAKYESRDVDPFRDWAARTGSPHAASTPLALTIDRLLRAGVDVPANVTEAQCAAWTDMIAHRRAAGLCSIKQAKLLKKRGLRWQNVKAGEAGAIIDAIQRNGWKTPQHVTVEYGA
jgi:superfamily II DNA or RNA helicase